MLGSVGRPAGRPTELCDEHAEGCKEKGIRACLCFMFVSVVGSLEQLKSTHGPERVGLVGGRALEPGQFRSAELDDCGIERIDVWGVCKN